MTEKEKSFSDYQAYIEEHISNVKQVWNDLNETKFAFKLKLSVIDLIKIEVLIGEHDSSKYSREEFNSYRSKFYPVNNEEPDNFDKAWNHHQKANPHHWQYWLIWKDGNTRALEMDKAYLVEMIIDWTAMAYKFGDTPGIFYNKNKDSIMLHDETKKLLEMYLPVFIDLAIKHKEKTIED